MTLYYQKHLLKEHANKLTILTGNFFYGVLALFILTSLSLSVTFQTLHLFLCAKYQDFGC